MIDELTAWKVNMTLNQRFVSATTDLSKRSLVLVRLRGDGAEGWGEMAPVPGHTAETVESVWTQLATLAEESSLTLGGVGAGIVNAGISQAKVALAASLAGKPLWMYLGGSKRVPASAAIGTDASGQPDRQQIQRVRELGYRNAKLKIDRSTDIKNLRSIIETNPTIKFGADANGSLPLDNDQHLTSLDSLGLNYIEQPGDPSDLEGHRNLRNRLNTPIALDESAGSVESIRMIIRTGAADIVNLKTGRFGTLTTIALAREVIRSGHKTRLGGLIESGIGRSHTIAAATTELFSIVGDIAGSDLYFLDDLMRPQCLMHDGYLTPSDQPGIGVVNLDAVDSVATDSLRVSRQ